MNTEFFTSTYVDVLEGLLSQTCHISVLKVGCFQVFEQQLTFPHHPHPLVQKGLLVLCNFMKLKEFTLFSLDFEI